MMKSPFTGMDPFIEACGLWGDFHSHLIERFVARHSRASGEAGRWCTTNLEPMIDEIYQRFRYPRSIDYSKSLTPPLDAAETGWLKQQLHVGRECR
jgi:hypothetical protein